MPPHQLTTLDPRHIGDAVLAVLAGRAVDAVTAEFGMARDDLVDAVDTFRAAGLAAIEQTTDGAWYHVRVEFPDWDRAEAAVAEHLGPRLDDLQARGSHAGWWFLRKHPHWRLRISQAQPAAVSSLLDDLVRRGMAARWSIGIYEPEIVAFGGATAMNIAHDLFCADSRGVLDHARRVDAGTGRRELSLLLLGSMRSAAGLDSFELGDVFERVAQIRPTPPPSQQRRVGELAERVRAMLTAHVGTDTLLAQPVARWLAAFQTAGLRLATAAAEGRLERGLRAILSHIVIFHWNRLGLSATTQGVLAHAASAALLPRS